MMRKATTAPPSILLVEDDPAHAELIKRSFEAHQVANSIYHVADGQEALDYLFRQNAYADEQKSPRPQLILLDLRLPKIGGLDVLAEIKTSEHLRPIPVVILTTSEAEKDIITAYDRRANAYVVKPIDFAKFMQLMEELGLFWLGWNRTTSPWSVEREA